MGAAAALLLISDPLIVFIDDIRPKDPRVKGFSKQIFKRFEWQTLKFFCNTYDIKHEDVCLIFKRFLQYEEVYLLQFKIRTKDVRHHFTMHSKLEQEIADAVVPLMFTKVFTGLDPPPVPCDAVSLARFTVLAYIFCAEQMPDAIFGFITMLKQKLTMTPEATLYTYTLGQLLKVLVEDLRPSAARSILLESLARMGTEAELDLIAVIKMGIKYPILFYVFERFRKHMRRIVVGDKFWKNRPQLKLKLEEVEGGSAYFNNRFRDEATAVLETSRSIISDVVSVKKRSKAYRLTDRSAPEVFSLEEEGLQKLKNIFGYERTRQLAVDSEIPIDCESFFVEHAFGQNGPVRHPPRGLKLFPGMTPTGILELPPPAEEDGEDDDDDDEGDEEREGEPREEYPEGQEFGEIACSKELAAVPQTTCEKDREVARCITSPVVTPTEPPHSTPHGDPRSSLSPLRSSSPSSRPHSPLRSSNLSPLMASPFSMSHMGMSMSMPSFASLALSWGTSRPATAELGQQTMAAEPEPDTAHTIDTIETILDQQQGREFRFDALTGKSKWVRSVVDQDGDLVLEYCS